MLGIDISKPFALLRKNVILAQSARGVMVLGVGTAGEKGLRFVRNMILARILAPEEFGLLAIILVCSKVLEALTEVGIKHSIIQNKYGAEKAYLNIAWLMQVGRGISLYLIALILAPWISTIYDKPELHRLLQVAFLALLFRGFINPRAYVLEKEFKFGRVALLTQGSGILGTIIALVFSFLLKNVWGLVIGFVSEAFFLCLLSYFIAPFRPGFRFIREYTKELFRFARGMFGLPLLTALSFHIDIFILGKLVTEDQLGMYFLALALTELPIELFSRIITPVLLPAFTQKQDDKDTLCRVVLHLIRLVAILCVPATALLLVCAGGILLLIYGSAYVIVAVPCAILSLRLLFKIEGVVLASVYLAMGRPHLHRRFVLLRAVMILGLIYPAIVNYWLFGSAAVVASSYIVATLMQVWWCRRIIDLKFSDYLSSHIPGILLSLPAIMIIGMIRLSGIKSPIILLSVGCIFTAIAVGVFFARRYIWVSHVSKGSIVR